MSLFLAMAKDNNVQQFGGEIARDYDLKLVILMNSRKKQPEESSQGSEIV